MDELGYHQCIIVTVVMITTSGVGGNKGTRVRQDNTVGSRGGGR